MKKKILIIQQPAGGGSAVALYEMVRNLSAANFLFEIVFYHRNEWSEKFRSVPNCKLHYPFEYRILEKKSTPVSSSIKLINWLLLECSFLKNYFTIAQTEKKILIKLIKQIEPDLIHHNNGILENNSAIRAAAALKLPQVLHSRGFLSKRSSFCGYLTNFRLLRKINFRLYISQNTRSKSDKKYFLSSKSGMVLNDFVSPQFLQPDVSCISDSAVKTNRFIISNVGRITEWKGQHVLIEAINSIREQIPGALVFLIGSYAEGIGSKSYFDRLKSMVTRYGLEDMIFFLGERSDIRDLMQISDLIVHTAVKPEPQGLVVIEALLCKKAIIAADAGGASELIEKYGGMLAKPNDAVMLSSLILQQYQSGKKKNQNVLLYSKLRRDFDPALQREKMCAIYNNILSNN